MPGTATMNRYRATGRNGSPTAIGRGLCRHAAICCAIALVSCTTLPSGPKYTDHPASRSAVPPESSRLTIYRIAPEERWQGSYRSANLQVDGIASGAVAVDEFRIQDVTPGRHVLRVDIPGMPGDCEMRIETTGGESYFLEVAARKSFWWAGQPGWALASIPFAGLVVGPLAFAAGTAIESSGKTCGGPFSIASVDRDSAIPKLAGMQSLQ